MSDLKDAALFVAVMLLREALEDEDPEIRNAARVLAERAERRYESGNRVALDANSADGPQDIVIGLRSLGMPLRVTRS